MHLRGFEESQDLRFKLSPLDKAIQPLYSQEHTDWRLHFHVGTLVEVKLGTHWVIGRVKHGTKRKNSLISSLPSSSSSSSHEWEIEVSAAQSKVGTVIKLLPADSELLCRVHTHTSSAHSSSSSITGSIEEGNGAKRASYSADSSHHTSVSTKLMRSTPLSSSAKSASSIASSSYGSSYGNRRTTGGTKGATGLTK